MKNPGNLTPPISRKCENLGNLGNLENLENLGNLENLENLEFPAILARASPVDLDEARGDDFGVEIPIGVMRF